MLRAACACSGLSMEANCGSFNLFGEQRPGRDLAVAGNNAAKSDAPGIGMVRLRVEAQALERNGEEHNVAVFGDPAFGLPDGIKAEIVFINAFRSDAVQLYPK